MTLDRRPPVIDTSRAHPARRYNYWLGGKDHFAADRASGDAIETIFSGIRTAAIENRRFLQRAVRYLVGQGVRQFLDIGTGLPTQDNTHEIAQRLDPTSRVVYVDNDPLVLVHARALLTSHPAGRTAYLQADLRHPEQILTDPDLTTTLDLSRPVAVLLVAVLHFVPDHDQAHAAVHALMAAVPAGSYLVISHATADLLPAAIARQLTADDVPGAGDFTGRTLAQVARFFDRLTLLEPGVEVISRWRPDPHRPATGGPGVRVRRRRPQAQAGRARGGGRCPVMPGTATATIRGGTIGDRSRIARILTEVFTGGDVAAWIVPEPDLRRAYSRGFFDHAVEHALLQGTVHIATDHDGTVLGAALWLSHTDPSVGRAAQTSPPPASLEGAKTSVADMRIVRRRQQLLDRLLDLHHPQRPHHHLAYLGVRPDRQGQGIGSQLLLYHHAFLHVAGVPAYLQADHPRNHDLYQRHGYTSIGTPILIPDTGLPLWTMWREPMAADYVRRRSASAKESRLNKPGSAPGETRRANGLGV